jgi:hypothetical protein
MDILWNGLMGFVIGYLLGVGCAVATMFSIYLGGYRKAMEDSLREEKSERYLWLLPKIRAKLAREQSASHHSVNK